MTAPPQKTDLPATDWLDAADKALCAVRRSGRNQVCAPG